MFILNVRDYWEKYLLCLVKRYCKTIVVGESISTIWIVSLGMVLIVSMSMDNAFVIAILGITKFTTWDGGAPNIAVSPEPNFRIDGDKVDPSLTMV